MCLGPKRTFVFPAALELFDWPFLSRRRRRLGSCCELLTICCCCCGCVSAQKSTQGRVEVDLSVLCERFQGIDREPAEELGAGGSRVEREDTARAHGQVQRMTKE